MTEPTDTVPVKSEGLAIVLLKKELGRVEEGYLREFNREAMEFPQVPKIRELNESIRFLEFRSTQQANNSWIPVSESPKEPRDYLVYEPYAIGVAEWDGRYWIEHRVDEWGETSSGRCDTITHWQPLPAPPQPEKE